MIEEINIIISWYIKLPKDYNNVTELIFNRQQLAGLMFAYTGEVGENRKAWNRSQATYETELVKWEMRSTQNSTKAKIEAKANTSNLMKQMKEFEGEYYASKENLESIREVLNSFSQSIAFARQEWSSKNFQSM